jgi:hypothetical protein
MYGPLQQVRYRLATKVKLATTIYNDLRDGYVGWGYLGKLCGVVGYNQTNHPTTSGVISNPNHSYSHFNKYPVLIRLPNY